MLATEKQHESGNRPQILCEFLQSAFPRHVCTKQGDPGSKDQGFEGKMQQKKKNPKNKNKQTKENIVHYCVLALDQKKIIIINPQKLPFKACNC